MVTIAGLDSPGDADALALTFAERVGPATATVAAHPTHFTRTLGTNLIIAGHPNASSSQLNAETPGGNPSSGKRT